MTDKELIEKIEDKIEELKQVYKKGLGADHKIAVGFNVGLFFAYDEIQKIIEEGKDG